MDSRLYAIKYYDNITSRYTIIILCKYNTQRNCSSRCEGEKNPRPRSSLPVLKKTAGSLGPGVTGELKLIEHITACGGPGFLCWPFKVIAITAPSPVSVTPPSAPRLDPKNFDPLPRIRRHSNGIKMQVSYGAF